MHDTIPLYQVDAFSSALFGGNPAAVCLLAAWPDDAWMQAVAAENNLSETAFVVSEPEGPRIRWFTPTTEVDLCGHATLASSHVLFRKGLVAPGKPARFHTLSGLLTAELRGEDLVLDFPVRRFEPCEPVQGLSEALGSEIRWLGALGEDRLAELPSAEVVRTLAPDFRRLRELPLRGVCVTARSDDARFDFVSRFFAPVEAIDEDPVTGSAHCALAPHWAERLGKGEMTGYQASARGGVVRVRLAGERVELLGRAVTIMRGELLV